MRGRGSRLPYGISPGRSLLGKRLLAVIVSGFGQNGLHLFADHLGTLVEVGDTEAMFTNPQERRTQDYIMGRFG